MTDATAITRRAAVTGGLATIIAARQAPAAVLFLKKSLASFEVSKGINLTRWANAPRTVYPAPLPEFYTLAELQELAALGLDHVRVAIAPDPLIAAMLAGDPAAVSGYIAQIGDATDRVLAAGLKCLNDMHFNTSSTWNANNVTAGGNNSAIWLASVATIATVAAALDAHYSPSKVAIDTFNEPEVASWATAFAPMLHAAVRAKAPHISQVIQGTELGGVHGLIGGGGGNVTGLDLSLFQANGARDRNILPSYHMYGPADLTNCGRFGAGSPKRFYKALPWPTDGLTSAQAIADATANINASELSAGQKTAAIAAATTALNNYFDNIGQRIWLQRELRKIRDWCDVVQVDPSQTYTGEAGAYQDETANSTSVATRAAWYGAVYSQLKAQDMPIAFWQADHVASGDYFFQSNGDPLPTRANVPSLLKAAVEFN